MFGNVCGIARPVSSSGLRLIGSRSEKEERLLRGGGLWLGGFLRWLGVGLVGLVGL